MSASKPSAAAMVARGHAMTSVGRRSVSAVLAAEPDAETRAVLELRRTGVISNDVWARVTRDLDLEDERLDV